MPLLNWLNKDQAVNAAKNCDYRLLEEVPELSYGEVDNDNLLIQGDNLEALKALIPFYAGKVKCIYIDPPYNTKSAFEHYDDNLEHSKWLSLIYPRLELLRELISEDGIIWISIDDREAHYLKVIMDEVFGRENFLANVVWQKRYSRENRGILGDAHEHLLVYVKNEPLFRESANKIPLDEKQEKVYKNPENRNETDPRKRWRGLPMTAQGYRPNQMYEIISPNGHIHTPPDGRCWSMVESEFIKKKNEGRVYWGKKGDAAPSIIRFLSEVEGLVPWTWWPHEDVGHTDESKKESIKLFGANDSADTPKPERLIQRIIHIATNENDLVLDSFIGSGTTAAVAHKMNRRYIGIEIGEHAKTHCRPRLQKVVDGEQGGISKAVEWQGGGGFRFCKLGHTVFDEYGSLNPEINFPTLAAHIWYLETRKPIGRQTGSPLLGEHDETVYYLLYNGILGDRRPQGGNVLTSKILNELPNIAEYQKEKRKIVVYGESTRLGESRLKQANLTFKQIPYDVSAL